MMMQAEWIFCDSNLMSWGAEENKTNEFGMEEKSKYE
jgi:hypothetical protein